MSFFIKQTGFEGDWVQTPLDAVRFLCDLFGLSFEEHGETLMHQLEKLSPGGRLEHEDLSLVILRF